MQFRVTALENLFLSSVGLYGSSSDSMTAMTGKHTANYLNSVCRWVRMRAVRLDPQPLQNRLHACVLVRSLVCFVEQA